MTTNRIPASPAPKFIEMAVRATSKSIFWELIDCPITLHLAIHEAEMSGERLNKAVRTAAKMMLKRVRDPHVRKYLQAISRSSKVESALAELETFRDRLIVKVANELAEAERIGDVAEYRKQRAQRIAITGRPVGKTFLAGLVA
ncbi:TPA: hypothetical protein ACHOZC_003488 [Raoultella ornithinolytica]